jgi:hypothetical protein
MVLVEIVGAARDAAPASPSDPLAPDRRAFVDDALALRKKLKTLVPCELSIFFCKTIVAMSCIAFSSKKPKEVLSAFEEVAKMLAKHERYLAKGQKVRGEASRLQRELSPGTSIGEVTSWLAAGFGLGLGMSLAAVALTLILGLARTITTTKPPATATR